MQERTAGSNPVGSMSLSRWGVAAPVNGPLPGEQMLGLNGDPEVGFDASLVRVAHGSDALDGRIASEDRALPSVYATVRLIA